MYPLENYEHLLAPRTIERKKRERWRGEQDKKNYGRRELSVRTVVSRAEIKGILVEARRDTDVPSVRFLVRLMRKTGRERDQIIDRILF